MLDNLSGETRVDYQVKKLFGKNIFYLLLYGFLESTKVSLRELEDIYNSQKFKFLFNIDQQNTTRYNSLSDRLSNMDPGYFKQIYEYVYEVFQGLYTDKEAEGYSIVRVDSTMVAETANKLKEGIKLGNQHMEKQQVKYTFLMEGILPSGVEIFTHQEDANENRTIPQAILNYPDKSGIFVFDRGVNKRDIFAKLDANSIRFITRLSSKAKYKKISSGSTTITKHNNLIIESDEVIRLYNQNNKLSTPFRLLKTKQVDGERESILFLTNCKDLSIPQVIDYYAKRWDIEVFFRFIKQELNFSHFISTTQNGISIVLYLTLILSMLILIYKKENQIGYKTAVRRFKIELDELVTKMLITFSGGDASLVFR